MRIVTARFGFGMITANNCACYVLTMKSMDLRTLKGHLSPRTLLKQLGIVLLALNAQACQTAGAPIVISDELHPQDILTVDCLLPPQVRQLGTSLTYLAPRQAIRTSGTQCGLRGGEYVAYDRADFKSALAVWLPKAKQGDPIAQTYVGEIYEKGLGTRASYKQAAHWYELASSQNHARAQINLGYLYESGLGVRQDIPRALNLYRDASGFNKAQLEYVSSVEIANRQAAKVETDRLKSNLQQLQTQLIDDQTQLQQQQAQLQHREQEVMLLRESLARQMQKTRELETRTLEAQTIEAQSLKTRIQATKNNGDENSQKNPAQDAISPNHDTLSQQVLQKKQELVEQRAVSTKRLAALTDELKSKEAEFDQQTVRVRLLQDQLHQRQVSSPSTHGAQIIHTTPKSPTINIIDPPVLLTRSSSSPSVRIDRSSSLIGKIEPVDGLFAFRINGLDHPYSENGLFSVKTQNVNLDSLELLAVDSLGQSTRLNLTVNQSGVHDKNTTSPRKEYAQQAKNITAQKPFSKIEFGNYHALIIGNNNYTALSNLQTAGNDAVAVESLLREKYGFSTTLVLDATQKQLLNALERLRVTLDDNDNLLIYYAGHGELDTVTGRGYWLPTDATPQNRKKWIANSSITAMVDTMLAKHVLVIADSCYSGAMTRSSVARALPDTSDELKKKWLKAIAKSRVRTVLSSGGLRPVLDGSANESHSLFANQFLEELKSNNGIMETYVLFSNLQASVSEAANELNVTQVPQYAPIRHAGHQAGEFIFVPQTALMQ